jgi:hypothetical protein
LTDRANERLKERTEYSADVRGERGGYHREESVKEYQTGDVYFSPEFGCPVRVIATPDRGTVVVMNETKNELIWVTGETLQGPLVG